MLQTKYGIFDGNSWEELCQLVFKHKYSDENYQEMPASPGDFGIEGYVRNKGIAFQCYCPDEHYTQKELYENQRDKITEDLGKLKTYQHAIKERIGGKRIKEWIFLTPKINDNKLLKHAQTKEQHVREWNLEILDDEFTVILKDADHYAVEIHTVRVSKGNKITLLSDVDDPTSYSKDNLSEYEKNIRRKNEKRCIFNGVLDQKKNARLNKMTSDKWTDNYLFFRELERNAADTYFEVIRVISQYEKEVEELCITWSGEAESLINKVKDDLEKRLSEAVPSLGGPERYKVADEMTSTWIALCPLDIEL